MKPLDRWPDREPLLNKQGIVPTWQLWFSALVTAVLGLQQHFQFGSDSPEGAVTATQGTVFVRDNGGAGSTLYVKESGGTVTPTNTGWIAK